MKSQLILGETAIENLNKNPDIFFLLAHDLNTLVTVLSFLTDLLKDEFRDIDDPVKKELLQRVYMSSKKIKELVLNLIECAKIQSIGFESTDIKLLDVVEEEVQLCEEQARQKEILFISEVSSPYFITGDKSTVKAIIRNLLNNSIKYSLRGSVVKISASIKDGMVSVIVKDAGIGMSEEILAGLFYRGKKISRKGTEGENGMGLGMIICQEFAELNGGKIFVESKVGKGSVFYFKIAGKINPNANNQLPDHPNF